MRRVFGPTAMANDTILANRAVCQDVNARYRLVRALGGILVLAALYFGAAKLGLSMAVAAEQVSAVWPPTGLSLAALLIFGYRLWPGIWLGAFLANATANEPIAVACGVATGNTLEAVAGSWLLVRYVGFDSALERLKDVLGLIVLAACASTMISATIGVASLSLGGVQAWSQFGFLWSIWWLGDAMGNLVVAPVLLTAAIRVPSWSLRRGVEAAALGLGLVVVAIVAFHGWPLPDRPHYSFLYTVFPFTIWTALRFGQQGTTIVTAVASTIAIWGAVQGVGPFGFGEIQDRLMSLQAFLGIVAMTGLLLAATLAERRRDVERKSVLHAVTQILAESPTLAEASPRIIQSICNTLAWQIGAIWQVDREASVLRCAGVWHVGSASLPAFEGITRSRTFDKGIGLPGRVWASGEPAWIPDVVRDTNFPRAAIAGQEGLHAAFGFPIRVGNEVHGVIEFFSPLIRQPDEDLLRMMGTIGIQIGQFIDRRHGDEDIRRSEARKAAILESALDAIITIDHEGRIVEFNPAAERMFGWARGQAIGRPLVDLIIPPALKEQYRRGMNRCIATGCGPALDKRLQLAALRADGTEFPVEIAVAQIPFPGPPMFTGYVRDITERQKLEDELLARAEQLLAADHRKNEFLATLAHELRNPLAPLRSGLEVYRLGWGDPQAIEEARQMMERQLAHMVRLVDDLLDVSRISRGAIELRKERTELKSIVQQAIETSRPIIAQSGHHLAVEIPPGAIYVDADLTRMAQVFSNILNNAAKYTEPGGQIRLVIHREGDEVLVSIRDNGIGIPAQMLPNVFDMFTQVDRSLERSQGGLGIGLSIVKRLVAMHGGMVEAHSDGQGTGSAFVVRLPVVLSVVTPQAGAEDEAAEAGRRRILVVDDNHDAAKTLAMLLRLKGNEAKTAHDGQEALELATSYRPDVILLDIGMPKLNGYEAARLIRQQPWGKHIMLVALTGWGQDEDRRKSHEAGFDMHLVKPIDPMELDRLLTTMSTATG
jgi:PAS domain S-box-containing protein